MRYMDEFRDKALVSRLVEKLKDFNGRKFTFMEVCGGHTMAIHRFGIPSLLPIGFKLISGPGCPVCVTGTSFIDKAIAYSRLDDFVIATYGDLIRVPGSVSSLEKEQALGRDIRIVLSPLDALSMAAQEPEKKVVFLGIGFETTAPGSAIAVKEALRQGSSNFFLFSAHKVMPPAMEAIIAGGVALDGFICPGHVSAVAGTAMYDFIVREHGLACVVTGFEPVDLLQALYMLALQVDKGEPKVEIQYRRAVTREGNTLARQLLNDVFYLADDWWRGLGIIPGSGLKLRDEYAGFDIEKVHPIPITESRPDGACICGDILRGIRTPPECKLFGGICTPLNPVGACMVSSEGSCHAYYRFQRNE